MKRLAFIALGILVHVEALACGICIDDKVASCYDHAVVASAQQKGHEVAFFAIDGSLPVNAQVRSAVLGAVQGARGVLKGTARVSLENAALSFAYDPKRAKQASVAAAIEAQLAARGLTLRYLRAMP